jgi:hypothetical protein
VVEKGLEVFEARERFDSQFESPSPSFVRFREGGLFGFEANESAVVDGFIQVVSG